jgi:hypothetical protein
MPEYLAPGVYIVEVDCHAKPIEGVSTSTSGFVLERLARDLAGVVRAHFPEWTGGASDDPGVTLLEAFAFLGEVLLFRAQELSDDAGTRVSELAAVALAALRTTDCPGGPLRDVRYFGGRRLRAQDFTVEQDATRPLRRLLRALHGYGIVEGLDVTVHEGGDGEAGRVAVGAGLAITRSGDIVELPQATDLAPPAYGDHAYVTLRPGGCGSGRGEIVSAGEVDATGIALARIVRTTSAWALDPTFAPERVRR